MKSAFGGQSKVKPVGWKNKRTEPKKEATARPAASAGETKDASEAKRSDGHILGEFSSGGQGATEIPPWMQGR